MVVCAGCTISMPTVRSPPPVYDVDFTVFEADQSCIVGTLPPSFSDPLQPAGLAAFMQGLRVSSCQASPSLDSASPTPSTASTAISPTTLASLIESPTVTATTSTTSDSMSTLTVTLTAISTTTVTLGAAPVACTSRGEANACIGGTGPGNYVGLCDFGCRYNYCPTGPCTCTAFGLPVPTPPSTGVRGIPRVDEDESYLGLCSFSCDHGYCPPTACSTA